MSHDDTQIELLTLTRLWLFPRYLYRVLDRPLGSPWTLRLLGLAAVAFPAAMLLLAPLPIGLRSAAGLGLVPHLFLPGMFVWWCLTRLAAGQKLPEVALSQARLAWHLRRRRDADRVTRLASRACGPWLPRGGVAA